MKISNSVVSQDFPTMEYAAKLTPIILIVTIISPE